VSSPTLLEASGSLSVASEAASKARRISTALLLVSIFVVTVVVRLPVLNKPLSHPREWLSATVLRHLQIWHAEGIASAHFAPIMTYAGAANKNIPNQASALVDLGGNYYYISFPPLAYYVPYVLFETLRIYPDVFPLQVFNLLLHFVSGIFVYLAIKTLLNSEHQTSIPAIIGFVAYIFSPQTLWLQANVYMSDIFVQVIFTTSIYFILRCVKHDLSRLMEYVALGVLVFFFCYAEWLGVMFAGSLVLFGWLNRGKPWARPFQLSALIGASAAVALTVWQYSQIAGFRAFITASEQQYLLRSGLGAQPELNFHPWNLLGWLFIVTYLFLGYAANFAFVTIWGVWGRKGGWLSITPEMKSALIFSSIVPPLLHHLLFFNFTADHEFSTLKDAPIIAVAAGLVTWRLWQKIEGNGSSPIPRLALVASVFLFCVIAVAQYQPLEGPSSSGYKAIGDYIARNSSTDEIIFAKYREPSSRPLPQMVLYAHRNVALWHDEAEARELARRNGVNRIVIFVIDGPENSVVEVRRINLGAA